MNDKLKCKIYPSGELKNLKYVVVCSYYDGKWMLSRHKKRDTWETQGGHIENGESPLDAAKRELFEESGVIDSELYRICDYIGYNASGSAEGAVFFAKVNALGEMPESEMEKVGLFDTLPDNLTYTLVTPRLIEEAMSYALEHEMIKGDSRKNI